MQNSGFTVGVCEPNPPSAFFVNFCFLVAVARKDPAAKDLFAARYGNWFYCQQLLCCH